VKIIEECLGITEGLSAILKWARFEEIVCQNYVCVVKHDFGYKK
jgi:hypothetical protein